MSQARVLSELLEEIGVVLDAAVLYELPEDEITARICGRRTCPRCKAVFHVTGNPPAKEGICNGCGAGLIQREDDRPDVVRVRLIAYREATLPVRDFYADRGELVAVSAAGTPEEVYKRTSVALATHKGMSGSRRIARAVEHA